MRRSHAEGFFRHQWSGAANPVLCRASFPGHEKRRSRSERALIAPFKQFQASDTVAWFAARGVKLKTECDGRMFPTTDSSTTIIDCLLNAARQAGVRLMTNCGVERITKRTDGRFEVTRAN